MLLFFLPECAIPQLLHEIMVHCSCRSIFTWIFSVHLPFVPHCLLDGIPLPFFYIYTRVCVCACVCALIITRQIYLLQFIFSLFRFLFYFFELLSFDTLVSTCFRLQHVCFQHFLKLFMCPLMKIRNPYNRCIR